MIPSCLRNYWVAVLGLFLTIGSAVDLRASGCDAFTVYYLSTSTNKNKVGFAEYTLPASNPPRYYKKETIQSTIDLYSTSPTAPGEGVDATYEHEIVVTNITTYSTTFSSSVCVLPPAATTKAFLSWSGRAHKNNMDTNGTVSTCTTLGSGTIEGTAYNSLYYDSPVCFDSCWDMWMAHSPHVTKTPQTPLPTSRKESFYIYEELPPDNAVHTDFVEDFYQLSEEDTTLDLKTRGNAALAARVYPLERV